jgi:hypothetical protein
MQDHPDAHVLINDVGIGRETFLDLPDPTESVRYRMTHELGHAVSQCAGSFLAERGDASVLATRLGRSDRSIIRAVAHISTYAQSSPAEAFAEVFAALNVPGGLAHVTDERTRERLESLRGAQVNGWRVL